jgi:threonine dehydratase
MSNIYPTLDEIKEAHARLKGKVAETPVHHWRGPEIDSAVAPGTEVILKLELMQHTGTFKARAALMNVMSLDDEQLARGVTAVSAGNHAIATAFAAKAVGTTAKVVMIKSASQARKEKCRDFGAEIIFTDTIHEAFDEVARIEKDEGRYFVHPFDGPLTTLGTATLGYEFGAQAGALDAIILPIGGGGLCAGMSCAIKYLYPDIKVYGVEPHGAKTMSMSFAAGSPQACDKVTTIADSLAPPYAMEYSYNMCRSFVDDIVLISDDQMIDGMRMLFSAMKLAVEPAGAATTAALVGPLKDRVAGLRVGVLVCGSNISQADFCRFIGG